MDDCSAVPLKPIKLDIFSCGGEPSIVTDGAVKEIQRTDAKMRGRKGAKKRIGSATEFATYWDGRNGAGTVQSRPRGGRLPRSRHHDVPLMGGYTYKSATGLPPNEPTFKREGGRFGY